MLYLAMTFFVLAFFFGTLWLHRHRRRYCQHCEDQFCDLSYFICFFSGFWWHEANALMTAVQVISPS